MKLAQSRFHLGETSELEVVQAAAELEVTAIGVLQLERDIPVQENLLSILIGMNPSSIERGSTIEVFQYPVKDPGRHAFRASDQEAGYCRSRGRLS